MRKVFKFINKKPISIDWLYYRNAKEIEYVNTAILIKLINYLNNDNKLLLKTLIF